MTTGGWPYDGRCPRRRRSPAGPYVVLPGASVPARAWPAHRAAETVVALSEGGVRVVVTGSRDEKELTAGVAGVDAVDLGGPDDVR